MGAEGGGRRARGTNLYNAVYQSFPFRKQSDNAPYHQEIWLLEKLAPNSTCAMQLSTSRKGLQGPCFPTGYPLELLPTLAHSWLVV